MNWSWTELLGRLSQFCTVQHCHSPWDCAYGLVTAREVEGVRAFKRPPDELDLLAIALVPVLDKVRSSHFYTPIVRRIFDEPSLKEQLGGERPHRLLLLITDGQYLNLGEQPEFIDLTDGRLLKTLPARPAYSVSIDLVAIYTRFMFDLTYVTEDCHDAHAQPAGDSATAAE